MKPKQRKYLTRVIKLQKIYTLGYEDRRSENKADQGAVCKTISRIKRPRSPWRGDAGSMGEVGK